jgi:hypothetical protein
MKHACLPAYATRNVVQRLMLNVVARRSEADILSRAPYLRVPGQGGHNSYHLRCLRWFAIHRS